MIKPIDEKESQLTFQRAEGKAPDYSDLELDPLMTLLKETVANPEPDAIQLQLADFRRPEKKKYTQNWSAYDKAKTNEYLMFLRLLGEVLHLGVDEPVHRKGWRPYSIKDQIFSMCVQVYHKSDLRKCKSVLDVLKSMHFIDKSPCYKSICNFFNDPKLSKILDQLILITALPLAGLDETGAIDSTGFTTSRFERWVKHKWGVSTTSESKKRKWCKAHISVGCKTNIIISVEVTGQHVADISMFDKVVDKRIQLFDMNDFTADKAYNSRKVFKLIQDFGLNPYIPFKKNARGQSKGVRIYNLMFNHFKKQHQAYMRRYHQRSNIETSNHMLKQRFGDNVRTKTLIGNTNEVKIKALCLNLCILIQEVFESDVSVDFSSCVKKAQTV